MNLSKRHTSHALNLVDCTVKQRGQPDHCGSTNGSVDCRNIHCSARLLLVFRQQAKEFLGRNGVSVEPSLDEDRLRRGGEIPGLLQGLHPFHDNVKLQRLGHRQNLRLNAYGHRFGADRLRERLIDLDRIDGKYDQIGQA